MKYALLIFALTFLCSSKDETKSQTSTDLQGKWVETEKSLDTLSFESLDDVDIVNLRGKELSNGNLLPKPNSGSYAYKLLKKNFKLCIIKQFHV